MLGDVPHVKCVRNPEEKERVLINKNEGAVAEVHGVRTEKDRVQGQVPKARLRTPSRIRDLHASGTRPNSTKLDVNFRCIRN